LAGIAFFAVLVAWTWFFGPWAYVPFVLVLSIYWAAAGAVIGAMSARGVAPVPLVAAAWVVVEAVRARWPFGGFSWGQVGYAFHDLRPARSLSAWGGILLVSLAAVLFNGFVLDGLIALRERRRGETGAHPRLVRAGVALVAVV